MRPRKTIPTWLVVVAFLMTTLASASVSGWFVYQREHQQSEPVESTTTSGTTPSGSIALGPASTTQTNLGGAAKNPNESAQTEEATSTDVEVSFAAGGSADQQAIKTRIKAMYEYWLGNVPVAPPFEYPTKIKQLQAVYLTENAYKQQQATQNYDLITCSTQPTTIYTVDEPVVKGTTATTVAKGQYQDGVLAIKLDLVFQKERWRIDKITCPEE